MTRLLVVSLCCALAAAGCGGDDGSSDQPAPPAAVEEPLGGEIGRVAVRAAQVTDVRDCPRLYAPGDGIQICRDYVTGGSLQTEAVARGVERTGEKAVADMSEPGGNPFSLLLRRDGGRWLVHDEAGLLPALEAPD